MTRLFSLLLAASLASGTLAPAARAAVNIERQGSENPVLEVAKSTVWGGLGGLALGCAIALVNTDNDSGGDIIRWCFVGGTFLGCGYGIYHVSTRPKASALIEFQGLAPSLHAALPVPEPTGGVTMRLVAVRF
jgi:hypothetical protein